MEQVARFSTAMEAMHFVAFLRDAGIPDARIFNQADPIPGFLGIDVTVGTADAARARRLLQEFKALPPRRVMHEDEVKPDLSVLPASMAPACPGCGRTLPLREVEACPGCGAIVDVPGLIVEAHGPEALTPCYPDPTLGDEGEADLTTSCPGCAYSLIGLERRGRCPECGLAYDKGKPPGTW
jgi:hypothetical protein